MHAVARRRPYVCIYIYYTADTQTQVSISSLNLWILYTLWPSCLNIFGQKQTPSSSIIIHHHSSSYHHASSYHHSPAFIITHYVSSTFITIYRRSISFIVNNHHSSSFTHHIEHVGTFRCFLHSLRPSYHCWFPLIKRQVIAVLLDPSSSWLPAVVSALNPDNPVVTLRGSWGFHSAPSPSRTIRNHLGSR